MSAKFTQRETQIRVRTGGQYELHEQADGGQLLYEISYLDNSLHFIYQHNDIEAAAEHGAKHAGISNRQFDGFNEAHEVQCWTITDQTVEPDIPAATIRKLDDGNYRVYMTDRDGDLQVAGIAADDCATLEDATQAAIKVCRRHPAHDLEFDGDPDVELIIE